jgi:ribosomal protein L2
VFRTKKLTRKGAAKLAPRGFAERQGYLRAVVKDIVHDPGRGAPVMEVSDEGRGRQQQQQRLEGGESAAAWWTPLPPGGGGVWRGRELLRW